MNENYIVINGKRAELTEEQLKVLGIEEKIISPFAKRIFEKYYFINEKGDVECDVELLHALDNMRHSIANYCTDENLMKQRALHETLNRLLWRFACENGELENKWDSLTSHWYISYSVSCETLNVEGYIGTKQVGTVYFPTKELAEKAIKEIVEPFMLEHPDFIW